MSAYRCEGLRGHSEAVSAPQCGVPARRLLYLLGVRLGWSGAPGRRGGGPADRQAGRIDQRLPLSVPSAEAAASLAEEATQSEHIADLDIQGPHHRARGGVRRGAAESRRGGRRGTLVLSSELGREAAVPSQSILRRERRSFCTPRRPGGRGALGEGRCGAGPIRWPNRPSIGARVARTPAGAHHMNKETSSQRQAFDAAYGRD
mmetsp:Transcript_11365/g.42421  ORF Transcript_11365/g.42421 Transcript_11365/m.42421 type:complete len:204 (-) Transcript_11365:688-1299(-)